MAQSGNGSRVSCGLTDRSLENRPLAASWPPMRDGLNGPMDEIHENQLWFVWRQSVSQFRRGPQAVPGAQHTTVSTDIRTVSPNCRI
jgi:hypothetical protein